MTFLKLTKRHWNSNVNYLHDFVTLITWNKCILLRISIQLTDQTLNYTFYSKPQNKKHAHSKFSESTLIEFCPLLFRNVKSSHHFIHMKSKNYLDVKIFSSWSIAHFIIHCTQFVTLRHILQTGPTDRHQHWLT